MSTNVILNGSTYSIPAEGDSNWGLNVSNYLIAIASACLQKTGGSYTLTAEIDFGATYGLKSAYFKSRASNPSSIGILRLGNDESIGWRNAANTNDLGLKVNSSDQLVYNAQNVLIAGNASIVNADIATNAAIALSKLAALTASRALVSDATGVISASSVTDVELGYLSGVTSAVQTQLNAKAPSANPTFSGTITTPLTASRALATGSSSELVASSVTATELGYLSGVTSAIQTQLNAKEPTITTLPISKGGTNSGTALNNGRVMISNSGAIVESSTTTTTLGYLDATSSVQTQLNGKANRFLSNLDANTTVNSSLIPQAPFTQNLGSSGYPWSDAWIAYVKGTQEVRSPVVAVNEQALGGSDAINIKGPSSMSASYDLTLPATQGAANSYLKNDGSGGLTWADHSDIGAATGTSLTLGGTLNASAILQADSTTKGFLPPRMTQTQRDAISTPATGLEVYNTTTNKLNIYNGTAWGEVGSGSSGINYITDTDGTVIGNWKTYADTAGTSPVDGTGGSANVTFATSTNSDLRGTTNFLFSHDANNRQGQGFSYDFTIDKADQAKMLQIRFDYLVASGTYADGDLTVWVYDVTNPTLIQPAPYKILNAVGSQPFLAEFQTASNSTSYRLIFHVTTNTATAYTMRFDNFSVGPQMNRAYGTPVTDWVSYTPILSSSSGTITNATTTGMWKRIGDSIEVNFQIRWTGTVGTFSFPTISIPNGLTINTSKFAGTNDLGSMTLGWAGSLRTAISNQQLVIRYGNSTVVGLTATGAAGTYIGPETAVTNTIPVSWDSGDVIWGKFSVPITGWSSNTVMSSDAATNVVAANVYRAIATANQSIANGDYKEVGFDSKVDDTNNAWTLSATGGLSYYIVPVSGWYRISATVTFSPNTTGIRILAIGINGAISNVGHLDLRIGSTTLTALSGSRALKLNAGDKIVIYVYQSSGGLLNLEQYWNEASIERISGPAQIAAASVVAMHTYLNTTQAVTNGSTDIIGKTANTWGTSTTYGYFDKTGSLDFSTGRYTIPISGVYKISCFLGTNAVAASANTVYVGVFKNAAQISRIIGMSTASNQYFGATIFECIAGDIIDIRMTNNSGSTVTIYGAAADAGSTHFSIERMGGVM